MILFLAALGPCCCTWVFSSCGNQGCPLFAVHRLLLVLVFRLQSPDSRPVGFRSCGAWAYLPLSRRNLPNSGVGSVPSALEGGFLTTGPPGKFSDNLHLWFPLISCPLECQLTLQWILQFQTSPRIINPLGNWLTTVSLLVSNGRRGLIEELKRGHVEWLSSTSTETIILIQTNKQ